MTLVPIAVIGLIGALSLAPMAQSDSAAAAFARQLADRSPKHDGAPLRTYALLDLDKNGHFEVLECVSAFEATPGFLNVELEAAFEWINVYAFGEGGFKDRTASYHQFLTRRKEHYLFWLRVIESPAVLSPDSRSLVEANREKFRTILRGYIKRIETSQ